MFGGLLSKTTPLSLKAFMLSLFVIEVNSLLSVKNYYALTCITKHKSLYERTLLLLNIVSFVIVPLATRV